MKVTYIVKIHTYNIVSKNQSSLVISNHASSLVDFMRDKIYKKNSDISGFVFDQKVVEVFDDMVIRSVPGYTQMIELIGFIARIFPVENSNIYDLGCSTGAATTAVALNIKKKSIKIFSVDNSEEMVRFCKKNIVFPGVKVQFINADVNELEIKKASMVILNLTLQFIKPAMRDNLIKRIYNALIPGGILIISEKVIDEDKNNHHILESLHESFKIENGYSATEISRKRKAIENVLIPDSIERHFQRLKKAGFVNPLNILKVINFSTFIAIKD